MSKNISNKPKYAFILTVFDKVEELLINQEIISFFPEPHQVVVISQNSDLKEYPYQDPYYPSIAPILALWGGLKLLDDSIEVVCYRNADDWLFNQEFTLENFLNTKTFSGYNWFSKDANLDFAFNELYINLSEKEKLMNCFSVEEIINSNPNHLVEYKLARWLNRCYNSFRRLSDREDAYGIGTSESYSYPSESNCRFFNEKWQMIGCHNEFLRYHCYRKIRTNIPYFVELEKKKYFSNWLRKDFRNIRNKVPRIQSWRVHNPFKKKKLFFRYST